MRNNNRFNIRVWNKVKKTYNMCDGFGDIRFIYTKNGYQIDGNNSVKLKDIVIEQCTGLRDKKRHLIYEGDIVYEDEYRIGTVIWDKEITGFVVCFDEDEYITFEEGSSLFTVIGNIHENPELLEEEE